MDRRCIQIQTLLRDLGDCRCPAVITASSLDHSGSQKLACIYEESFPSQ